MIRAAATADAPGILALVTQAFGQDAEANLVDRLRALDRLTCELVAEECGVIVGHIAFSPVRIGDDSGAGLWWGLAPLAVAPASQKRGIGSTLVRTGLDAARSAGASLVVVLGEPDYYGRFGFRPAEQLGLRCIYDVPRKYFMACRPMPATVPSGTVRYDEAFDGL